MKEVIVSPTRPLITTHIHEVDIPVPHDDEILIRVVVAASNPKDHSHLYHIQKSINSGDDIAGYVEALGSHVASTHEFKIGDRVAAFHQMGQPGGAYAEYAIAPAHTSFLIPDGVSFEEASTIPLTTLAAALPLFRRQKGLPPPWEKLPSGAGSKTPLIIYGASSALGTFAIKLASLSNIHPIIAIAGGSSAYVSTLLDASQGDTVVDYRLGVDAMKQSVKEALHGLPAYHALDAISENQSWVAVSQMLGAGGVVSVVQAGGKKYDEAEIPKDVTISYSYVGTVHSGAFLPSMPKQPVGDEEVEKVEGDGDFAFVLLRYLARMMSKKKFEGHPYEVIPGGLGGVESGLRKLQKGEARGVKFVYKIEETTT